MRRFAPFYETAEVASLLRAPQGRVREKVSLRLSLMSRTRRIRRGPDPAGGEARKTASPSPDEDAPDVLVVAVMDQREVMKEEERWLQEGREVRMAGAGRGYERSATRCPWTLVPPAAYRGYKDVNDAWAAGVLAVGAWPAALGAGALAVPAALCEVWAERLAWEGPHA